MGALQFCQRFAYHLLGQARTFSTLSSYVEGFTYFFIAAATLIDRIADLPIGNALAEADIHKIRPSR